jgi:hypothetical protein
LFYRFYYYKGNFGGNFGDYFDIVIYSFASFNLLVGGNNGDACFYNFGEGFSSTIE